MHGFPRPPHICKVIQCPKSYTNIDEICTDPAPEESGQAIPEPMTSLFDPTSASRAHTVLAGSLHQGHTPCWQDHCIKDTHRAGRITASRAHTVLAGSLHQGHTPCWQDHCIKGTHRTGWITASRAHSTLGLREDGTHKSFLETTLQYGDSFSNAATQWCIDNEATARNEYMSLCRKQHNFHVVLSGLVCAQEPQFAPSPDGITYCACHAKRLTSRDQVATHTYRDGLPYNCYQDTLFLMTDRDNTIETIEQTPLMEEVRKRKLKWFGHMMRSTCRLTIKTIFEGNT